MSEPAFCGECFSNGCTCPDTDPAASVPAAPTGSTVTLREVSEGTSLEPPDVDREHPPRSTWARIDLDAVLAGDYEPPRPTIGKRRDLHPVLYRGKTHSVVGQTESGKTWLAYSIGLDVIADGHGFAIVDFEDTEETAVHRLRLMGATDRQIRDHVAYIRPEQPLTADTYADVRAAIGDVSARFVFLDGVTEALRLHGLDPNVSTDVSEFTSRVYRRITRLPEEPALLASDHVVKDTERQGRNAIGSVHKTNLLDGASFVVTSREPHRPGKVGRATVTVAKDRNGALRAVSERAALGDHFADLVVDSTGDGVSVALYSPRVEETDDGPIRYPHLARPAFDVIACNDGKFGVRDIQDRVKGRAVDIRAALASLVDAGYITKTPVAGGKHVHSVVKAYGGGSE